jgi:hypothetical protein
VRPLPFFLSSTPNWRSHLACSFPVIVPPCIFVPPISYPLFRSLDEFTCPSALCFSRQCALCILRIFGEEQLYLSVDADSDDAYYCLAADCDLPSPSHP